MKPLLSTVEIKFKVPPHTTSGEILLISERYSARWSRKKNIVTLTLVPNAYTYAVLCTYVQKWNWEKVK